MHFQAHAKLTLSLRVTGLRPDGLHEIESEMVAISLSDDVEILQGDSISFDGPYAGKVGDPAGSTVAAALRSVNRTAAVRITKNIPVGAGLGGGSADAAAILRWAGSTDLNLAASIGADVPFCVVGRHAQVTGIGEVVTPLDPIDKTFTLFTPDIHVDTARVYKRYDETGPSDSNNDLELAAITEYPELVAVRDVIQAETGIRPQLAGSGSTWFLPEAHQIQAKVHGELIPGVVVTTS